MFPRGISRSSARMRSARDCRWLNRLGSAMHNFRLGMLLHPEAKMGLTTAWKQWPDDISPRVLDSGMLCSMSRESAAQCPGKGPTRVGILALSGGKVFGRFRSARTLFPQAEPFGPAATFPLTERLKLDLFGEHL
jgi:hypothetical protein